MKTPKPATLVNHPPRVSLPADNRPLVAPVYHSVKFCFDNFDEALRFNAGERDGYIYSRVSNPTLRQLELTLSALQGREGCLLVPSGVAAMSSTMQALCRQGDHVLVFAEGYLPTRAMVRRVLARFGVSYTVLSVEDLAGIERVLAATPTRLLAFESPTNPVLKIADLERICELAKRHGALTVLDNTLAGMHAHGEFPIDIYVHSLTKYANGHGDVLGGAVIANSQLIAQLRPEFLAMGVTLDPQAAFLVQRGLKTYALRYERACENALTMARFLEEHGVERVRYPGLASHPQHELARRQMRGSGTIVTLDLGDEPRANRFVSALKLFKLAASLGSTESLVLPPCMLQPRDLNLEQRVWAGVGEATVRLSVGIENAGDLLADLAQALDAAGQPVT